MVKSHCQQEETSVKDHGAKKQYSSEGMADMNYQMLAKDKLKQLTSLRIAVCNLEQRIINLDKMIGWCKKEEDKLSLRAEREELIVLYRFRKADVQRIEQALHTLDPQQRLILDRFYIHRSAYHIERLSEELGYERRAIYYHHDEALRQFALALYGLVDG